MKVLILGGAGYIGSVLCEYLMKKGIEVVAFDSLLYDMDVDTLDVSEFIKGDICNIDDLLPVIEKCDAVVNLAAISNDPASDLAPRLTWEINYKANEMIAKLCMSSKKRVVYISSCSVYGFSDGEVFDEESKLSPVTLYARTKMLSEEFYTNPMLDGIVLRLATVYGYSPKPRFDLVVNTMIGTSFFNRQIVVNGGKQWRPVVHVKDVVHAIYLALSAHRPNYKIYNVGSNNQNIMIEDLADTLGKTLSDVTVIKNEGSTDVRSYKVDFSRIEKDLGFSAIYDISDAVSDFYTAFKNNVIKGMEEDEYYRVKYLKKKIQPRGFGKRIFRKIFYMKIVGNIANML